MTTTSRNGFTLVELVVVILIMGIMAISVYPRFISADSENAQSQRDMLLALSHLVQLQSMQDTVNSSTLCPTIVLSATQAGIATTNPCLASASFSADVNDPNQIQFGSEAYRPWLSCWLQFGLQNPMKRKTLFLEFVFDLRIERRITDARSRTRTRDM